MWVGVCLKISAADRYKVRDSVDVEIEVEVKFLGIIE